MEFIDTTGHIFSIESYEDEPINIKYKEGDYIFWVKDEEISINNYYIRPVRFIIPVTDIIEEFSEPINVKPFILNISVDSKFFKLLGPKVIQEKLELNDDIKQKIEIYYDEAKSELTIDDFYFYNSNNTHRIIVYSNNKEYYLFQFYVIAKSEIPGTFLSNIMIERGSYKEYLNEEKVVWLDRDQMYDYLMKLTMTDILVYEYDPYTQQKTYFFTIPTGYNGEANEIITADQVEYKYRVRNWGGGMMRPDVYHYIYRFPENKWLLKDHWYIFEGEIFESCHYCGSPILYNHDGGTNSTDPLLDLQGKPYYPEEFTYNEELDRYIPKGVKQFLYGQISGIYPSHSSGQGYEFKDTPFQCTTTIRDIFFDIDNEKVTNNKEGGYITIKKFNYEYYYTQITVGGTFIDECEELVINGRNMGIQLPKDILKAIYESSFYNKYSDEVLFKDKMKELLMNYMSIKGECGNFKSAINSLKWFGWGDKIQINQLIKTDNEFQDQYIIDYFNIDNDIKDTYKYFNPTNYITLSIKDNEHTGKINIQDYNKLFWGEGQPLMEDLFDKVEEVYKDDLIFYKPYYDFIFTELAIKLDCLRYYYQRYFLPLHLRILRSSIEHKVYANDIKMNCYAYEKITASPAYIPENTIRVEFPDSHELLFYKSMHLIDNKFNEFSNYNNSYSGEDLYYIYENCIKIPIKFIDDNNRYSQDNKGEYILKNGNYYRITQFLIYDENTELYRITNKENATYYRLSENTEILPLNDNERYSKITSEYFSCKIILTVTEKVQNPKGHYIFIDGQWKYKNKFYAKGSTINHLIEDENGNYVVLYNELVYISPKNRYDMITKVLIEDNSFNYYQTIDQYYVNLVFIPRLLNVYNIDWLNSSYRISVLCNNKWFYYDFTIKIPNLYLDFGKLSYRYYIKDNFTTFKQIKDIIGPNIFFNSFIYQPDLVTIDTLFKEEDTDNVLSFIDKIQETRLSRNEETLTDIVDENKMYEFVRKYYKKQITVPYNKNFFNRIHLFDIYNGEYAYKGFGYKYVVVAEYFGWHTWGNEWSEYNGGKQNLIKGWGHLVPEFFEEYPNGTIIFYRNDGESIIANNSNLTSSTDWNSLIVEAEYTEFNISHIELKDNEGKIIYNLKYINEDLFSNLVENDNTDSLDDDIHISHIGRKGYWYNTLQENHTYKSKFDEKDKLEYDNNPMNIQLYNLFFPEIKNYNFIIDLKEKVPYDVYLMHDKYQVYTNQEIDEHNASLDFWNENTIKAEGIKEVLYTEEDEEVINGEKNVGDVKIEGVEPEYYTQEEIDEHNSQLDVWAYGKRKEGKKAYWYLVFISKYPIGNYQDESMLDIDLDTEFKIGNYLVKYSGFSLDKFLVNRMDIQKSNGYNHFNKDDIVIASINNNDYQFNIDLSNKWEVQSIYDPSKNSTVNSNANIMIINTNNFDQLYSPGYYNVKLNYIIDGINVEEKVCKGYYRINKDHEDIDYDKYSYDDLFAESDYFIKLSNDSWAEIPETTFEYYDRNDNNTIKTIKADINGKISGVNIEELNQENQNNPYVLENIIGTNWKSISEELNVSNIKKIILGTNVTQINAYAFNDIVTPEGFEIWLSSSLIKIVIPCFEHTTMMTNIKIHQDNPWFDSRNNCNSIILTNDDPLAEHLMLYSNPDRRYSKNTLIRGSKNTFIPKSIEDFSDHVFCSISGLNYIDTGNNVTYIGNSSLWNLSDLETLILGANISRIMIGSITEDPKLKTVYIRAKTPPIPVNYDNEIILEGDIEGKITISSTPTKIYVEPGYGDIYKNHYAWRHYESIIEEMPGEF